MSSSMLSNSPEHSSSSSCSSSSCSSASINLHSTPSSSSSSLGDLALYHVLRIGGSPSSTHKVDAPPTDLFASISTGGGFELLRIYGCLYTTYLPLYVLLYFVCVTETLEELRRSHPEMVGEISRAEITLARLRRKVGGSLTEAASSTHPTRVKVTQRDAISKSKKVVPHLVGVDEHPSGATQRGPPKWLAEGDHSVDQHADHPPSKRHRSSLDLEGDRDYYSALGPDLVAETLDDFFKFGVKFRNCMRYINHHAEREAEASRAIQQRDKAKAVAAGLELQVQALSEELSFKNGRIAALERELGATKKAGVEQEKKYKESLHEKHRLKKSNEALQSQYDLLEAKVAQLEANLKATEDKAGSMDSMVAYSYEAGVDDCLRRLNTAVSSLVLEGTGLNC